LVAVVLARAAPATGPMLHDDNAVTRLGRGGQPIGHYEFPGHAEDSFADFLQPSPEIPPGPHYVDL